MKGWAKYRQSLEDVWEDLTEVAEKLQAMEYESRSNGSDLLHDGSGQLGSHLQELAERIEELSRFTGVLRDLVDRAERRGISEFTREAVKTRMQHLQQSKK